MGKTSAFCPSYITGIFTIAKGDAAGAGFTIDRGMTTVVRETSCAGKAKILINGKKSAAPVSRAVLRRYEKVCGNSGALEISHSTPLPIGFGMGMSAAGAVSLSLALNEILGAGLSFSKCVKVAHDSEVECGTGLSGADAAAIGGFIARKSVRHAPEKLPFEERRMRLAFFSAIRTSDIISSPDWKRKVNVAGRRALASLFSDKSWDGFVGNSREFAIASGLAKWCESRLSANPRASMAMVGRTLFSDANPPLGGADFKSGRAMTSESGAGLV